MEPPSIRLCADREHPETPGQRNGMRGREQSTPPRIAIWLPATRARGGREPGSPRERRPCVRSEIGSERGPISVSRGSARGRAGQRSAEPRRGGAVGARLRSMASVGSRVVIDRDGFAALLGALVADGYELVGPTVRDGAIVLEAIRGIDELPRGVGDEQAPGHYRLRERGDDALFGYAASPHSWKRELLPPRVELVQLRRSAHGLAVAEPRAAGAQGRVHRRRGRASSPRSRSRIACCATGRTPMRTTRRGARTCSCSRCTAARRPGRASASRWTPGRAPAAASISRATELLGGRRTRFVVEVGTEAGRAMLERRGVARRRRRRTSRRRTR